MRLEGDLGFSAFGLDLDKEGAALRGALSLGPLRCGPGFLAGPASFFSSPLSRSSTSLAGASFKIDPGFTSGLSLLSLELGPATVFALCRNGGKGLLAAAPGLAAPEATPSAAGFSLAPQPITGEAGCGKGIVAHIDAGGGELALIAAASRSGPAESGGSWRLDARPDPGGFGLVTGLAYEAKGQDWRSAFGLEYSWGPLRGGGAAVKFEGSALLDPFRLSVMAGYAAPNFRDCIGEGEDKGAVLDLGFGLPLWSGTSFRASGRMECPSFLASWPRGYALYDLVGRSATLAFCSRLGGNKAGSGDLQLRSGLSFGLDSEGCAFLAPDLALSGRAGPSVWNAGLSGRWMEAPGDAEATPSLKATFKATTPSSASLSLVSGYSVSWKRNFSPTLDASMGLSTVTFANGRISVLVEWRRIGLGILEAGEERPAPVFSLRYCMAQ